MKPSTVTALAALLVAFGNPIRDGMPPYENPFEKPVFYDPWPMTQLDARSMVRGGRWRALARWRAWWRKHEKPANRYTSRRKL